jgi:hypothetical protein
MRKIKNAPVLPEALYLSSAVLRRKRSSAKANNWEWVVEFVRLASRYHAVMAWLTALFT